MTACGVLLGCQAIAEISIRDPSVVAVQREVPEGGVEDVLAAGSSEALFFRNPEDPEQVMTVRRENGALRLECDDCDLDPVELVPDLARFEVPLERERLLDSDGNLRVPIHYKAPRWACRSDGSEPIFPDCQLTLDLVTPRSNLVEATRVSQNGRTLGGVFTLIGLMILVPSVVIFVDFMQWEEDPGCDVCGTPPSTAVPTIAMCVGGLNMLGGIIGLLWPEDRETIIGNSGEGEGIGTADAPAPTQ